MEAEYQEGWMDKCCKSIEEWEILRNRNEVNVGDKAASWQDR